MSDAPRYEITMMLRQQVWFDELAKPRLPLHPRQVERHGPAETIQIFTHAGGPMICSEKAIRRGAAALPALWALTRRR
jgi:hypothetical protein